MKACLNFIYNHRYEGNVERLEALYGKRFGSMFHLMPFYRGARRNIIRTHCGSYQFQGFIAGAWEHLPHEGFTHYVFLGDDLLLHPSLNENNLSEALGLAADCGYIKELTPLTAMPFLWRFLAPGLATLAHEQNVQWKRELPDAEETLAAMEKRGLPFSRLGWKNFRRGISPKNLCLAAYYFAYRALRPSAGDSGRASVQTRLPYPLLAGYADFVVVPAEAMEKFAHYCGVLAAAGLFVEIALPTALALACPDIRQEKDTAWHGIDAYTGNADLSNPYQSRLDELLAPAEDGKYHLPAMLDRMTPEELYVHPVKLSRWQD